MVPLALACHSATPPPGVPADALHLDRSDDAVRVDGKEVRWDTFSRDPTEVVDPDLSAALATSAGRALWVDLPPDTEFWAMRRILGSASDAGSGSVWVGSSASEAFSMSPPPKFAIASCQEAPIPVEGVEPMVTLSLQTGREGQWVVASARFVPITTQRGAKVPTDGLEPGCLVADCAKAFTDPALVAACEEGGGVERVELGASNGCFLPIARAPEEVARWRAELPGVLGALGLGERAMKVVMPEARSRVDAVLAVVGGFVDARLPPPSIGTSVLVEGNDGPPVCNATVRDRAALDLAAARWLGSLRPAAPPEAPSGP
jgi:hypothetical protein